MIRESERFICSPLPKAPTSTGLEFHRPSNNERYGAWLLTSDETVTTFDGRRLKAASLPQDRTMISFGKVLERALDVPRHSGRVAGIYGQVIDLIADYNEQNPAEARLQTIIIIKGTRKNYLIPVSQEGQVASLVKEHRNEIESSLGPFYISREDLNKFKTGDPQGEEKVRARLTGLGMKFTKNWEMPQEDAERIVKQLISHPSTNNLLRNSEWPIINRSDFCRFLAASLHRAYLNYHRDTEARKRRKECEDKDPLIIFFRESPPDSERARRLLATLSTKDRNIFTARFFENKRNRQIAQKLHTSEANISTCFSEGRAYLSLLLTKPVEDWQPADVVRETIELYPDLYEAFLEEVSARYQLFAQLKYKQGLRNKEIAERMGTTEPAVKSLGHRFGVKFRGAAALFKEDEEDIEKIFG